jgi:alpha-galactosidase
MTARVAAAADGRTWLLDTPSTSYAIHLTDEGRLVNLHWGPRMSVAGAVQLAATAAGTSTGSVRPAENTFDGIEELPVEGEQRYGHPALAVRFADQVRGVEWTFIGAQMREQDLELHFRDRVYPLDIALHYRVFDDCDVIERWVDLRHTGEVGADAGAASAADGPIEVLTAFSAAWAIPFRDGYRLSHLHGHWGGETQLNQVALAPTSTLTIGSRTGTTGHLANPWFAVDDGTAGEEHGEVWSGALAWSGTWRIVAERFANGRTQLSGGFGRDGFRLWRLTAGEPLRTPVFAGVYAAAGFGAASRQWHAYLLGHVLPRAAEVRPVLYNSWEATGFDINEQNQRELAAIAADLGVELFVMDDGWFGARTNDRAGLGDWTPNPDRFPNGLSPLVDEVHKLGMQFGIWVEPEMVNPDSDLYRAHPDWVYHYPNRRRSETRNQLVLNLARRDVADWVYDALHRLLAENAIDYVKWDMNRPISEPGWPDEPDNPERVWVDHVHNLYGIFDQLRREHPNVTFESCSGGGGRVDFGILARTDMVWTSDNTSAFDRLAIQHGFTQVYAPRVMSAWVTDHEWNPEHTSLRWRFHSAMAGLLGVGSNLLNWSAQQRAEATELIATYKRIRHVVQFGMLYRLLPPAPIGPTAVQYVTRDGSETVVLAWQHTQRFRANTPPLRLRGLHPERLYRDADTGTVWPGAVLTAHGIPLGLRDQDSRLIHLISSTK